MLVNYLNLTLYKQYILVGLFLYAREEVQANYVSIGKYVGLFFILAIIGISSNDLLFDVLLFDVSIHLIIIF